MHSSLLRSKGCRADPFEPWHADNSWQFRIAERNGK